MKSTSLLTTLPQLMVELIVIVVGILMALWVDAWWTERADRQAEQTALVSIHEEFAENKRRFELSLDHHTRIHAATVQISESTPSDCDEELVEVLSLAIFDWHTFNPVGGTTRSLISSGRLDLISDQVLRIQLASWNGLYSDLEHDEIRTVEARDRVSTYVAREFPELDCNVLLGDGAFRFLLVLRQVEEFEVLNDNDQIPEAIQKILDATGSSSL